MSAVKSPCTVQASRASGWVFLDFPDAHVASDLVPTLLALLCLGVLVYLCKECSQSCLVHLADHGTEGFAVLAGEATLLSFLMFSISTCRQRALAESWAIFNSTVSVCRAFLHAVLRMSMQCWLLLLAGSLSAKPAYQQRRV